MKSILVLLSFFSLFYCQNGSSQTNSKKKTDLEQANLKGKVKQVKQNYFTAKERSGKIVQGVRINGINENYLITYDNKGDKIEKIFYNPDGSLSGRYIWRYDDKRNLIECTVHDSAGSLISKSTYRYDGKGDVIEEIYSTPAGDTSGIKSAFRYDNQGNLIVDNYSIPGGSLSGRDIWRYDDRGNVIERDLYNPAGSLGSKITYGYDGQGNKIEQNYYVYTPNDTSGIKTIWKYDNQGNTIEWNSSNIEGGSFKNTYQHDGQGKGNIIEIKENKSDNSLMSTLTYKYEYDKQGNWIKRTEFENDTSKSIATREIIYY